MSACARHHPHQWYIRQKNSSLKVIYNIVKTNPSPVARWYPEKFYVLLNYPWEFASLTPTRLRKWQLCLVFKLSVANFRVPAWWHHQMVTFSALLTLCAGKSPLIKARRGALMFSLIWAWINGWVNNREAGDLRRQRAHHDLTVMHTLSLLYWIVLGHQQAQCWLQSYICFSHRFGVHHWFVCNVIG